MPSIRCSVTLLSDKSHTVDIEVRKEKKDFLWKVITASGGSLRLSANDGTWEVFGDNMLIFWYETTGKERKKLVPGYTKLPTLVIHLENDAFFDNIINNGNIDHLTRSYHLIRNNANNRVKSCLLPTSTPHPKSNKQPQPTPPQQHSKLD